MAEKEKIDLFKELKNNDYKALSKPVIITTREAWYLTIEGMGAPGGIEFTRKIGALYGMACTIKMTMKSISPTPAGYPRNGLRLFYECPSRTAVSNS